MEIKPSCTDSETLKLLSKPLLILRYDVVVVLYENVHYDDFLLLSEFKQAVDLLEVILSNLSEDCKLGKH